MAAQSSFFELCWYSNRTQKEAEYGKQQIWAEKLQFAILHTVNWLKGSSADLLVICFNILRLGLQ